jgi:sigma-B regulation protein RsbU (phosphoserine phosphatase)
MRTGYYRYLRQLGRIEKAFLVCLAAFLLLHWFGAGLLWQALLALPVFFLGLATVFRGVRRILRGAVWRLRNRLILAYVFIAVVPVILILVMAALAGYVVIGEMAVYLANRELDSRLTQMHRQALALARVPARGDAESALNRAAELLQHNFPEFELVGAGAHDLHFPPETTISEPPAAWKKRDWGLAVMHRPGKSEGLYAWVNAQVRGTRVTIVAPINHGVLEKLVPGLGDVSFLDPFAPDPTSLTGSSRVRHIPAKANLLDVQIEGFYPIYVSDWDAPQKEPRELILVVFTRLSAVLGTVFQNPTRWNESVLILLVTVSTLLLLVELASLIAGVQLSRTITGAVHELYEGTQHVKGGNFSYRIPVQGHDQLADLSTSFNSMTENLGRLIVVAKEKERLESELEIAREVQSQLFPKDVPRSRTLELKGVCSPARMVSGDYYDFMALPGHTLGIAIGDVAGKGISAALLMATIQSTMRTQLSAVNGDGPRHFSSAALVSTLNRQLYATTSAEKYATFYFALYDEASSSLTYTNAGHLPPFLLRGSDISTQDSNGTVVGAFPISLYEERTVQLLPGDLLVAYTDGITEPENAYGEMFGEDRLKELLVKYAHTESSEIIARTMEAVVEWTGSTELQDDMTMIMARHL